MQLMPSAEIATRVDEVLEKVGLEGYEERGVGQLSGGQQQRVALARAIAPSPRLLMFDEPLGSLDRALPRIQQHGATSSGESARLARARRR